MVPEERAFVNDGYEHKNKKSFKCYLYFLNIFSAKRKESELKNVMRINTTRLHF